MIACNTFWQAHHAKHVVHILVHTHTHAYTHIIESLGMDEAELFNMYREVPSVARKASWALDFTKELDNPNFETGEKEQDKKLKR